MLFMSLNSYYLIYMKLKKNVFSNTANTADCVMKDSSSEKFLIRVTFEFGLTLLLYFC